MCWTNRWRGSARPTARRPPRSWLPSSNIPGGSRRRAAWTAAPDSRARGRSWPCGATARSPRRRRLLHVHLQAFLLDDGREFGRLRLDEIAELLRRAVIGARAHGRDVLSDVVALQHRLDLQVEGIDDLG